MDALLICASNDVRALPMGITQAPSELSCRLPCRVQCLCRALQLVDCDGDFLGKRSRVDWLATEWTLTLRNLV